MTKLEPEGGKKAGVSWRTVLTIALFLGFFISLSESLLLTLFEVRKQGMSLWVISPLLPKIIMTIILYGILWFLVVFPLARVFKLDKEALSVSLGILIIVIYALCAIYLMVDRYKETLLLSKGQHIVAIVCEVFLAIVPFFSWLIYSAVKALSGTKRRILVIGICLAVPLLLVEAILALYIHSSLGILPAQSGLFKNMLSFPALIVNLTYVICATITLAVFVLIRSGRVLSRLFEVFALVIFVSSILIFMFGTGQIKAAKGDLRTGHSVKHVILIIVDTLRADALSCYGGQRISTANIDQLAEDAICFKKAFSAAPWTVPSVASIMTGLTPLVHMAKRTGSVVPDVLTTLAEYMREAGYLTHAIGENPVLTPKHFQQGFMSYDFFPKRKDFFPCGKVLSHCFPKQFSCSASTSDLTRLAMDWLESNADKEFFLWLHYYDPHVPYEPPEEYLAGMEPPLGMGRFFDSPDEVRSGFLTFTHEQREWMRTLYDGEVRYVDDNIGLLLNHLKQLGIYDDTLIVLTSDHGEEFWEHGEYEHGHTLYNELLWVPLMFKLVGSSWKGDVEESVSIASILSTILELCKIEYKQDYVSCGSLVPVWAVRLDARNMGPIISTGMLFYEEKKSVIFDDQKYIRFQVTDQEEFYDLARDQGEKFNIAYTSETKVKEAEELLRKGHQAAEILKKHYSVGEGRKQKLDADMIHKLKTLGYTR